MQLDIRTAIERSLRNIAKFGDTDIFPFLFERHVFFDRPDGCKQFLLEIHDNFEAYLNNYPPITHESLTQVGYTGFRWATQIEPFWNAYYLALVLCLADQIENTRIPTKDLIVFSYRYKWSDAECKIFLDSTWNDYRKRCIKLCSSNDTAFVVLTDIADFYPRIYHHRLENQLTRLAAPGDIPRRIMKLLQKFSKNASYGLPVGGPASRILSELALNAIDKHLRANQISFCRYADDYALFCKTRSEAYANLVFLAEKLFVEGLVLQKNKTRILASKEFYNSWQLLDPTIPPRTDEQKLLNISIRFDPYSETAEEDYEKLSKAVAGVNVLNILAREIKKTAIDTSVAKQAINAIRALGVDEQVGSLRMLLDTDNLDVLSPVFVTLMRAVRGVYDKLGDKQQTAIDSALTRMYEEQEHILRVEVNLAYYLQALSRRHSQQKEEILIKVYRERPSPILRRIVIATLANWGCDFWLSDFKDKYGYLDEWEKRAAILASYFLTDEGRHWRMHTKSTWSPVQKLISDWFSDQYQTNKNISA